MYYLFAWLNVVQLTHLKTSLSRKIETAVTANFPSKQLLLLVSAQPHTPVVSHLRLRATSDGENPIYMDLSLIPMSDLE